MAFSPVLQMYLDWANSLLCEHGIVVNELKEFQDGRMFSLLINILSGTQLFPASEDSNDDDISSSDRVQTILDYLTGLGIKLKVTATGVLNGELKSILDVIWAIILHFTIHSPDTPVQQKTVRNGKKQLVQWCASQLGEQNINTSKGLAQFFEKNNKLADLIGLFCTYSHDNPETHVNNLTSALIAAEDSLGITKSLLSPADVISGTVEEHSLTIYLALLRRKVTQLGPEAAPAELSGETDTGLPHGLTEEVANSLSQTFSFKFMRSPRASPAKAHPSAAPNPLSPSPSPSNPSQSSAPSPPSSRACTPAPSTTPALNPPASSASVSSSSPSSSVSSAAQARGRSVQQQKVMKKNAAPSRIPVSSSKLSHGPSKTVSEGTPKSSSARKRQQVTSEEQREQGNPSSGSDPSKMPSGIPVRKTQKLSALRPVQTSTPVSKPRRKATGQTPEAAAGPASRADIEDAGIRETGPGHAGSSRTGGVVLFSDREPGVTSDAVATAAPGTELDMSDIEEVDWKPEREIVTDDRENFVEGENAGQELRSDLVQREGESLEKQAVGAKLSKEDVQAKRDASSSSSTRDSTRAVDRAGHTHAHFTEEALLPQREEVDGGRGHGGERGHGHGDVMSENRVVHGAGNTDQAEELPIREDGDGQRILSEQPQGLGIDYDAGKDGSDASSRNVPEEDSASRDDTQDSGGRITRGEELSFTLPKSFVGRHGDELDAMLEAIASESKQLRQQLNNAKAREDFLTKKLNERYSSQEEEVINRLVGELEMLRRENQRLFQELAVARETGAEDHKCCEKLQAAVERLEMDVERLTAENFRLKFAADTGYQVTDDELMAAMEDGDIGFQSLPSPGRANVSRESVEAVPSPILEAQSDHESRLLAMRAETSSMRKLQELLAKAHAENKRLKAQEQERRNSTSDLEMQRAMASDLQTKALKVNDLQAEVSKVAAELTQARTAEERLGAENAGLRREIQTSKVEMEELRQKLKELEEVVRRKAAAERDWERKQTLTQGLPETGVPQLSSHAEGNIADPAVIEAQSSISVRSLTHHRKSGLILDVHTAKDVHVGAGRRDASPTNEITSQASDDLGKGMMNVTAKKESDIAVQKDGMAPQTLSTDEVTSSVTQSGGGDTQDKSGCSQEAVVDWMYLAVSPEPENEMRTITQYISPFQETGTSCTSEVESETESRASDLFASGSVASPVGRLMVGQDRERRPSLGGLIVERAQKSPQSGSLQQLSAFQPETGDQDDTLIDASYLATSPDYVTADENSMVHASWAEEADSKPNKPQTRVSTHSGEGMTPYFTPVVQRSKLQFSSVTSSLESLKSISRKAREDIESETPVKMSTVGQRIERNEPTVPTLEAERRWIQEELGRIRLDQNIPGDKYPDLGMDRYRERSHKKSGSLNTEDNFSFISARRYVPKWRKFQFRNRRSKTSEGLGMYSSTPSDLHLMSDSHQLTPEPQFRRTDGDLGRVRVQGEEFACIRSAHMNLASRHSQLRSRTSTSRSSSHQDGSPSRSSSDEEYKPLPSELREPHKLAESSPSKRSQASDQNVNAACMRDVIGERNAGTAAQGGITPLTSQVRKNDSPDSSDLFTKDQTHIGSDRTNTAVTSPNLSGRNAVASRGSPSSSLQTKPTVSPSRGPGSGSPQQTMQTLPSRQTTALSPKAVTFGTTASRSPPSVALQRESGVSSGMLQSGVGSGMVQSGVSGGMLQSDYVDALAEKVIREADSGVSLSTNLDPKNGLSTNIYQHRLLSLDEQTYANSLIEKYMEKMVDKY